MPLTNIDGHRLGDSVADKLGNRNIVVNGSMLVAQRGTSSTSVGYQTVDRITLTTSGTDEAPTQAQGDVASGTTPYSEGLRKTYKITNGDQTSGAGASDRICFDYRVEAQDIANSGWNYTSTSDYLTVSYWVKSSVAQTFYVRVLTKDGTTKRYAFETGSLTADTWTKVTKHIPGHADLQFDNDNGSGLEFRFYLFRGTDNTDNGVTLDAWANHNGSQNTPDQTSTWYTTDEATFEITGFQIEVGATATPFEHRSYGDELARCQRYYFRAVDGARDSYHAIMTGMWYITTQLYGTIHFPVEMRADPTLSYSANSNTAAFKAFNAGVSSTTDDIATQQSGTTTYSIYLYNLSAQTAGNGGWAELNNESGAFIAFAAEL